MPPSSLVACNIYITAAASQRSALLRLLREAQRHCQQLRNQNHIGSVDVVGNVECSSRKVTSATVGIIHAYADIPYDRSSFHIAGRYDCVSDVVSSLVCSAIHDMQFQPPSGNDNSDSRHPFVGLVDHVSIMPLVYPPNNNCKGFDLLRSCDAAANVAREIGKQMSSTNLVNVHYYGRACPHNTPLSTVRRERTSFFGSGGAIDRERNGQHQRYDRAHTIAVKGDTTIGTPVGFVENFNIRLTSNVSIHQAKSLTQYLRGRNISTRGYGVVGVEALTLPYVRANPSSSSSATGGGTVYEVACNLTKPEVGGVVEILDQLKKWIEVETTKKLSSESNFIPSTLNYDYFVEDAYRVGTTEEQCLLVLLDGSDNDSTKSDMFWEGYDKEIYSNFEENLLQ